MSHLTPLEARQHFDEADRVKPARPVAPEPYERVQRLRCRPADERALGCIRPDGIDEQDEGEARERGGGEEEEEVDDGGIAAGGEAEQTEREVAGDRPGAARPQQHPEPGDARGAPRRAVDAEDGEGHELRPRHDGDCPRGRGGGHPVASRQRERAAVCRDDEQQVDDHDQRAPARQAAEDGEDQPRPCGLQLVKAEGLDEPDDHHADAERDDVDRPARDAGDQVGERGRAGGGHVEEEHGAPLVEAQIEQSVMHVPAVGPRRVAESVRQALPEQAVAPCPEAAREEAPGDGERGVGGRDRDEEERGERRHDRSRRAGERQHGEGIADDQAAGVAEKDGGGIEVVGQEAEERRREHQRRGGGRDVAAVHGRPREPDEADEADARGEAVEAVGQVECVGDEDDPDPGEDGVEERRSEPRRVAEVPEPETPGDGQHGGGRLRDELRLGAQRPDVVDHADREQEPRADEDQRAEVPRWPGEHEAGGRGERDADPSGAGRRPRVHAASVGHVGGAAEEGQPADDRRGGEADQERGGGGCPDHAASAKSGASRGREPFPAVHATACIAVAVMTANTIQV